MPSETDYKGFLTRYLDDQLDADEERLLFQELLQGDLAKWQEMLEVILIEQIPQPDYNQERWSMLINKITENKADYDMSETASTHAHRIHFLKTTWFRYAAAVIIMFGVGAYLWTTNKKNEPSLVNNNKQLQTDVLPGGDKAVLTLADGSKIVLDNAANGNLAQQGNAAIVKLANGQITYNLKGLAEGDAMMNTMATPKGGQYQLTLPDGSKVWLNAASSIQFPAAFVGSERKVKITGEVYFEITKNKAKPFIVDVDGKSTVQVLGTSFNVNSYQDENNIKTTLIEGSVRVSSNNKQVVLKPHQQAEINPTAVAASSSRQHKTPGTDDIKVSSDADIEQTLAWKNGLFNLNGLDVRAVMRQLERWYDIDVRYEGSMPSNIFRGKMYRSVKLSTVLEKFRKMGINCRMDGKTVIVTQ